MSSQATKGKAVPRQELAAVVCVVMIAALAQAQSQDRATALVTDWYNRYLGRYPDLGAAGWVEELRRGRSPQQVLSAILGSDEYYTRAGRTPEGFLQLLFQDVVGRPPSRREFDALLRRAWAGRRNDVAYSLLLRYPQGWEGGATAYYPPYQPGYNAWPSTSLYHFPYDYRRPWHRFGDWR
jgi:hypothetical protein